MEEEVYIINPDYIIKNDENRYVLYNHWNLKNDSVQIRTFLHPLQVQLFSYFSQEPRTFGENLIAIAKDYGYSVEEVKDMLTPFIENKQIKILKYQDGKSLIPKNFIINIANSKKEYKPLFSGKPDYDPSQAVDLQTGRLNKAPYNITFMLTNKCCTQCCYCYADTKTTVQHYVPVERIICIIEEAKKLQLHNINILGGEVFLYKNWDTVLTEIIKNGFMPELISTKIPIDEEIIRKLKATGYTNILQLSIDTLDQNAASQTLHVSQGYVEKIKKGVALLEQYEIPYQVGTVLTKWTAGSQNLCDLYVFFCDKKCLKQWEIRQAMYSLGKSASNFLEISAKRAIIKEIATLVKNEFIPHASFKITMEENAAENKFRISKDGCRSFKHGQCSAMNTHLFILPDGKATICEQLYWNPDFIVGDINHSSLEEIWHSPQMMKFVNLRREDIHKESACKTCNFFEMCFSTDRNRCWADVIKAYGSQCWDFPDPYCYFAPELKNDIYAQY